MSRTFADVLSNIPVINVIAAKILTSQSSWTVFLVDPITATSWDLFRRSFLGCIADVWNNVQMDHIRLNVCQSWTVLLRNMQTVICTV